MQVIALTADVRSFRDRRRATQDDAARCAVADRLQDGHGLANKIATREPPATAEVRPFDPILPCCAAVVPACPALNQNSKRSDGGTRADVEQHSPGARVHIPLVRVPQ